MKKIHLIWIPIVGFILIALGSFGWRRITMGLPPIGGAETNSIVLNLQHPGNPNIEQPRFFNKPAH